MFDSINWKTENASGVKGSAKSSGDKLSQTQDNDRPEK